jgi:hypothetical protein
MVSLFVLGGVYRMKRSMTATTAPVGDGRSALRLRYRLAMDVLHCGYDED